MPKTTSVGVVEQPTRPPRAVVMQDTPRTYEVVKRRFLAQLRAGTGPTPPPEREGDPRPVAFDPATCGVFVVQDRGGGSKTFTCVHLARAWLAAGVLYNLVDFDVQGDAAQDGQVEARMLEFFPEIPEGSANRVALSLDLRSQDKSAADPEEGIREAIVVATDLVAPGVADFPANKGLYVIRTLRQYRPWWDRQAQALRPDFRMPALVVPMAPDADAARFALAILREADRLREDLRADGLDPQGLKVLLLYGMAEARNGDPLANYTDMSNVAGVRKLGDFLARADWVETVAIPAVNCPLWNVLKGDRIDLFSAVTMGERGLRERFGAVLHGIDVRQDLAYLARMLRTIWQGFASAGLMPLRGDEVGAVFADLGVEVYQSRADELRAKIEARKALLAGG